MVRSRRKKNHKSFKNKDLNIDALRKQLLRMWMRDALKRQSPSARKNASRRIAGKLFGSAVWRRAKTVLAFASLPNEVDTAPIVRRALSEGKRLALPFVDLENKELKLYSVEDPKRQLKTGVLGIRQPDPRKTRPVAFSAVDLVLVPALAFDRGRGRLGRGGGYYDRLLSRRSSAATIGLAFSFQIFSELPLDKHDRAVGRVVTELEDY